MARKLTRFAVVFAACLAMLALVGCQTSATRSAAYSAAGQRLFEEGSDLPPTAETLYALSRLLASQGRDAECEQTLISLVRQHPGFVPAYCALAEVQVRHRRIDDAIQSLSAGLRVAPQDAVLLNDLGMCWFLKGDHQRALESFGEAAGVAPQDALYRANMAMVLGLMGRYEESSALYGQVLSEADVRHNLAVRRDAGGDRAGAAEELQVGRGQPATIQ